LGLTKGAMRFERHPLFRLGPSKQKRGSRLFPIQHFDTVSEPIERESAYWFSASDKGLRNALEGSW
jgi:hypothetical protein